MKGIVGTLLAFTIVCYIHGAPCDKGEWLSVVGKHSSMKGISQPCLRNAIEMKRERRADDSQWYSNMGDKRKKLPIVLNILRLKSQLGSSDSDSSDSKYSKLISLRKKILRKKISEGSDSIEKGSTEEGRSNSDESSSPEERSVREEMVRGKKHRGSRKHEKHDSNESSGTANDSNDWHPLAKMHSKYRELESWGKRSRRDSDEPESHEHSSSSWGSSDESDSGEGFERFLEDALRKNSDRLEIKQMLRNRKLDARENLSKMEIYYNKLYNFNRRKFLAWKKKIDLKRQLLEDRESFSEEELKRICNISEETEEDEEEDRIAECVKDHVSTNDEFTIVTDYSKIHPPRYAGSSVNKSVHAESVNGTRVPKVFVEINKTLANGSTLSINIEKQRGGELDSPGSRKVVKKIIHEGNGDPAIPSDGNSKSDKTIDHLSDGGSSIPGEEGKSGIAGSRASDTAETAPASKSGDSKIAEEQAAEKAKSESQTPAVDSNVNESANVEISHGGNGARGEEEESTSNGAEAGKQSSIAGSKESATDETATSSEFTKDSGILAEQTSGRPSASAVQYPDASNSSAEGSNGTRGEATEEVALDDNSRNESKDVGVSMDSETKVSNEQAESGINETPLAPERTSTIAARNEDSTQTNDAEPREAPNTQTEISPADARNVSSDANVAEEAGKAEESINAGEEEIILSNGESTPDARQTESSTPRADDSATEEASKGLLSQQETLSAESSANSSNDVDANKVLDNAVSEQEASSASKIGPIEGEQTAVSTSENENSGTAEEEKINELSGSAGGTGVIPESGKDSNVEESAVTANDYETTTESATEESESITADAVKKSESSETENLPSETSVATVASSKEKSVNIDDTNDVTDNIVITTETNDKLADDDRSAQEETDSYISESSTSAGAQTVLSTSDVIEIDPLFVSLSSSPEERFASNGAELADSATINEYTALPEEQKENSNDTAEESLPIESSVESKATNISSVNDDNEYSQVAVGESTTPADSVTVHQNEDATAAGVERVSEAEQRESNLDSGKDASNDPAITTETLDALNSTERPADNINEQNESSSNDTENESIAVDEKQTGSPGAEVELSVGNGQRNESASQSEIDSTGASNDVNDRDETSTVENNDATQTDERSNSTGSTKIATSGYVQEETRSVSRTVDSHSENGERAGNESSSPALERNLANENADALNDVETNEADLNGDQSVVIKNGQTVGPVTFPKEIDLSSSPAPITDEPFTDSMNTETSKLQTHSASLNENLATPVNDDEKLETVAAYNTVVSEAATAEQGTESPEFPKLLSSSLLRK